MHAGLSAVLGSYEAFLVGPERTGKATCREVGLWPHLHASYELLPHLGFGVTADGGYGFLSQGIGGEATLTWDITRRWDVGPGYRLRAQWIDTSDLRSNYESHLLFVAIGRSF